MSCTNTQILSGHRVSHIRILCPVGSYTGEEGSLTNAFCAFCHTFLAHKEAGSLWREHGDQASHSHPDITLRLIRLF